MSPVIYVSPAFRTACAEPRGALLLLHSDPVRSAPIVGSAASGARLLILREQNGWCHVRTRTACGWVSKTDIVVNADYAAKMQSVNWQLTNYRLLVS